MTQVHLMTIKDSDGEFPEKVCAIRRGKIWVTLSKWTQSCSGCFEGGEYGGLAHNYRYDNKAQCHIGMGCGECGYTGKRRVEMYLPIFTKDEQKMLNRRLASLYSHRLATPDQKEEFCVHCSRLRSQHRLGRCFPDTDPYSGTAFTSCAIPSDPKEES